MMERWESEILCCAARDPKPDVRFDKHYGPTSERALVCSSCHAIWIEEWSSVAGYDGADDRDFFRYLRVTEEQAAKRLGRAP
jgi:hypothetical protein